MKINLSQIYEGWKNHWFPRKELNEIIKQVSDRRLRICSQCEHNSKFHKTIRPDEHCMECGCTLTAKTKCLSCDCPLPSPKWKAVVTEKEEDEMIYDESG